VRELVQRVLDLYPRIYLACHTRHVQDPRSGDRLSAQKASILSHLDTVEPVSLLELARHMGVTPATMSIAVGHLVRGGYVKRARSKEDGRRLEIVLTAKGARTRDASSVLDPERVRALLERLEPAPRARALEGLELLARAADGLPNPEAPGATRARGRKT
jgi:DNA-binding MarR family transcriptional regulator